jgi:ketosteroid isomerase-like protein
MSESDERLKLLQDGIDAFNRGDASPALEIFAADVECYVAPDLMNAGTYHGHDGYLEMVAGWGEAWETVTADVAGVEELENDHLLVEIDQRAVGAGSGVPVRMSLYWLFEFVDGKVRRFHLYADREAAIAASQT